MPTGAEPALFDDDDPAAGGIEVTGADDVAVAAEVVGAAVVLEAVLAAVVLGMDDGVDADVDVAAEDDADGEPDGAVPVDLAVSAYAPNAS